MSTWFELWSRLTARAPSWPTGGEEDQASAWLLTSWSIRCELGSCGALVPPVDRLQWTTCWRSWIGSWVVGQVPHLPNIDPGFSLADRLARWQSTVPFPMRSRMRRSRFNIWESLCTLEFGKLMRMRNTSWLRSCGGMLQLQSRSRSLHQPSLMLQWWILLWLRHGLTTARTSKRVLLKKKAKVEEQTPEPQLGPGGFPILDLAGDGDCGWRCVSFAISFANNKGFKDQPNEMTKLQQRIKEIGQVAAYAGFLTSWRRDNSWRASWAVRSISYGIDRSWQHSTKRRWIFGSN